MQTDPQRPDPEALLRRVQAEEQRARQGRLRIFFGAHAGVGKTYAMLRAAHQRRAEGIDVVVGIAETHGRQETEALLDGLEVLPRRVHERQGAQLGEFDLDAALARQPGLILVDELAHSNLEGARHSKRWQDVEELLAAGIDVDTTLNVQHLESLGDVVARITEVQQRETIPDHVLERADEVVLIDLPPEQFERRLAEGKVYYPAQAQRASQHFFRKGNLIALRELALRRTADRVDAQMRDYRSAAAITQTWAAGERLLVGVGPSPFSQRLVRATRRMAASLHCEWRAVFVETPATVKISEESRARVEQGLRLAAQMGARTDTVSGEDFAGALLAYARRENVTRLIVGKPQRRSLHDRLFGTLVDRLIRDCGDIDVYVITGDDGDDAAPTSPGVDSRRRRWADYLRALAIVGIATLVAALLHGRIDPTNLIMLYLLGLVLVARRCGRGPSIAASLLSVAAFDYFFVPPHLTFAVADTEYLFTFLIMMLTGLVISDLVARVRDQATLADQRQHTTALLHTLGQELTAAEGRDDMLRRAVDCLGHVLKLPCALILPAPAPDEPPHVEHHNWDGLREDARELGAGQWVIAHGQRAGTQTQTLPSAAGFYLPLPGRHGPVGALGLRLPAGDSLTAERLRLFETVAAQLGQALEREMLRAEARSSQQRLESEQLRNTLLSSVSHELRTPLTVIAGAAESLADGAGAATQSADLIALIRDEADRLDRLVQNLLQMSRMEAGMLQVHTEWQVLEELVGNALQRLACLLGARDVVVQLDPELPLVDVDGLLIEQVLINLLENAHKFSPAEATIRLVGERTEDRVVLRVQDAGPGIDAHRSHELFQRYVQGPGAKRVARPGVGLGLALSAAIVRLHGGEIWGHNLPAGGAEFGFSLPLPEAAPEVEPPPAEEPPA